MKKTALLVVLLLTFSFAPAFADGSITGPTSGQGPSTSVVLDGLRYIWNEVQDFFSSGKGSNTTSGSGYVPPAAQSQRNSSQKSVTPAEEKKNPEDKQKKTKTIKPAHRPADTQKKVKPSGDINSLRRQIYNKAYHAVATK